jgi:hypothetical protein
MSPFTEADIAASRGGIPYFGETPAPRSLPVAPSITSF